MPSTDPPSRSAPRVAAFLRGPSRLLVALILLLGACGEGSDGGAALGRSEGSASPPSEPTLPLGAASSALAAPDFVPPCAALEMGELGGHDIPALLATLASDPFEASTLRRRFVRKDTLPSATLTGHQPRGHVFRWELEERIAEPRMRFRGDLFRTRITQLASGAPIYEDFENRQIRTLEARLRTQIAQEIVLSLRLSSDPATTSLATLTCVDHGPLPSLSARHFLAWIPEPQRPALARLSLASLVGIDSGPELRLSFEDPEPELPADAPSLGSPTHVGDRSYATLVLP